MLSLTPLLPLVPLFLLGLAVGSFLNVVSRRLLRGEPITGRSHCESCGKILSGVDLIPLLSFFLLRGRCRYCGAKLSWQYPLVEGGAGLLFAALGFKFLLPLSPMSLLSLLLLLAASSALIVIFITDLLEQRIFDQVVLAGIVSALLYRLLAISRQPSAISYDLLLASSVFLFFWLLRLATRGRGMGEGDPPVGFLAIFLVGFPQGLVAFFLAFIFGAVVGLVLILLKKKRFGEQIPFGPFLVVAAFVSIFFGEQILNWYLRLLGI